MKLFEVIFKRDGEPRWRRLFVRAVDERAVDRHFADVDEYDCREVTDCPIDPAFIRTIEDKEQTCSATRR